FAGRGRDGLMTLLAQIGLGEDPDLIFVLDDQNGGHCILLRPERVGSPRKGTHTTTHLATPGSSVRRRGRQARTAPRDQDTRSRFFLAHDLFRKPVPTFRDHALAPVQVMAKVAQRRPGGDRAGNGKTRGLRAAAAGSFAAAAPSRRRWPRSWAPADRSAGRSSRPNRRFPDAAGADNSRGQ